MCAKKCRPKNSSGQPVWKSRYFALVSAHPARGTPPERAVGGGRETRATRKKRGTPRGGSGRGAGVDVPRQPSPRTPRERAREPAIGREVDKASAAFEDVAGEGTRCGRARANAAGRRARADPRETRVAMERGRGPENAASPDVPRRSSPARSPRAARDVDGNRRARCSRLACLRAVRDASGDVPAGARARRSPDEPRGSPPTPYQRKRTPLCVWRVVEARPRVEEWRDARAFRVRVRENVRVRVGRAVD